MKELVQFLAQQLVNNPDAVDVKDLRGETVAKGLVRISAESFAEGEDVVVHRDDLVLLRRR